MSYYSLKPQDAIPADASAKQLAEWYLIWELTQADLLHKIESIPPFATSRFRANYLVRRARHEMKKIREAAAARSFNSLGIDLSQFKGISHAE